MNMAKESTREDRMRVLIAIAEPVECALTGAGREEGERPFRKRLFQLAARGGPEFRWRAHVRVAPAGVDEEDLRLRARNSYVIGDSGEQKSEGLLPPFPGALRGSVGCQQGEFATDPAGVPTEIDNRDAALLERSGEAVERVWRAGPSALTTSPAVKPSCESRSWTARASPTGLTIPWSSRYSPMPITIARRCA